MKKVVSLIFMILLLSCSEDEPEAKNPFFYDLLGEWQLTSATRNDDEIMEWRGLELNVSINRDEVNLVSYTTNYDEVEAYQYEQADQVWPKKGHIGCRETLEGFELVYLSPNGWKADGGIVDDKLRICIRPDDISFLSGCNPWVGNDSCSVAAEWVFVFNQANP